MYAYIEGKIAERSATSVVLDVGGVGYFIQISLYTFSEIEDLKSTKLYIHHHQREDVQALFGFSTKREKELFGLLLSVSGVGPNTTRIILSSMDPETIEHTISSGDVAAFKKVKGVGPKTAQRIIIDLKDKVAKISGEGITTGSMALHNNKDQALSALLALGFSRQRAGSVLDNIQRESQEEKSVEDFVKRALKLLA